MATITSDGTHFVDPGSFTVSGDRLYFYVGSYSSSNYDLWRTDGTAAGTFQVLGGSQILSGTQLVPVGTHGVMFANTTAAAGTEPWISDGTSGGTKLLKDLAPGSASGLAGYAGAARLASGKTLFVTSAGTGTPTRVWTTDGTTANTTQVTTFSDDEGARAMGTINGVALLGTLAIGYHGNLYRSDGTAGGTYRLPVQLSGNGSGVVNYNNLSAPYFTASGDSVFFTANDGVHGMELWRITGSAAPVRLTDIFPGAGSSQPFNLTPAADGTLYFTAMPDTTGNRAIYAIKPGAGSPTLIAAAGAGGSKSISGLTTIRNTLYFNLSGGTMTGIQLWRYAPATGQSAAVTVGGEYLRASNFVQSGNYAYFGALPFSSGGTLVVQRLYRVDSSATAVPQIVADISSGTSNLYTPTPVAAVGSTVYFMATTASAGTELWKTTGSGATFVRDLIPGTGSSRFSPSLNSTLVLGGTLYFIAEDVTSGIRSLWRSDGTIGGTIKIAADVTNPSSLTLSGGNVYFIGTANGSAGVFRVNGTSATRLTGTAGGDASFAPTGTTAAGGRVFVTGLGTTQIELWSGDASLGGFAKIANLAPYSRHYTESPMFGFYGSGAAALSATANNLYFPIYTDALGLEPYRIALTTAATASLSGYTFNDSDADGTLDANESKASGKTVFLDANNNGLLDGGESSVVTGSGGTFTFTSLAAGAYHVREVLPSGYAFSTTPIDLALADGQAVASLKIGIKAAPVTPPASLTLEAENATLTGGTYKETNHANYAGTGFADFGGSGSAAQWNVSRTSARQATLTFRYANGGSTDRPLSVVVNGVTIGSVACKSTGSWDTWSTVSINVSLLSGSNTIKAIAGAATGGNVDSLTIS